jgi:lysophospholipase L1-like esterase
MYKRMVAMSVVVLATVSPTMADHESQFLPNVKRVLFLGDSITFAGQYIDDITAYVATRFPERRIEFFNLGLSSETVSGLSEPGHGKGVYPRPMLRDRLERVLKGVRPDLVVACYGMNDGIYAPFDEGRFVKFKEGILHLRSAASETGAKIVHITPPPFDPEPIKNRTVPSDQNNYSSVKPYESYDEVLDRYSQWLLEQRANGWVVVDVHGPLRDHLKNHRQREPDYRLAADGIHLNAEGHWLMARKILAAFGAADGVETMDSVEKMLGESSQRNELLSLVTERNQLLRNAWLTSTGHKRPGIAAGLPLHEAERKAAAITSQLEIIVQRKPSGGR